MDSLTAVNIRQVIPPFLQQRLRDYLASSLLADNLPPVRHHVITQIDSFSQLVSLCHSGKPVLYKKRNTLSLLFDVFALQSEMRLDAPDELMLGYTQTMIGFLLFDPNPARVGMIGLGGGSLAKFCHRHLPATSIEVAEIDPAVIALRDYFHIPRDEQRLQIHCMDGADFIKRASQRFDVILVDGFDRQGQPPQLCSQSFYEDCRRALTGNGLLVVNLLGDSHEMQDCIERLHRAFDGAVVIVDALDSLNKIVFAGKGRVLDASDAEILAQAAELRQKCPVIMDIIARNILLQRNAVKLPNDDRLFPIIEHEAQSDTTTPT